MKRTPKLRRVGGGYVFPFKIPHKFFLPLLTSFFIANTHSVFSQCTMTCTSVQVSVDQNCMATVTWDMILEGDPDPDCLGPFYVELYDEHGDLLPSSPTITEEFVNRTISGKVTDDDSGNNCSANILVEDKLAPSVSCIDTLITCFDETHPDSLGYPEAFDNCNDTLIYEFNDNFLYFACNTTDTILIINRLWTVSDSSQKSSNCIQKIYVERPKLDSLSFPENLDDISNPALACPNPNTDPSFTGMPNFKGTPVDSICSFGTNYTDVTVTICEGSYSVFREWEIYDACDAESITATQIIHVFDTLPPSFICPSDITVNTSNLDCTATVILPQPATNDSCGSNIALSVEGSFGIVTGTTIYNLPYGIYPTNCIATDDCGNSSSCLFQITVDDNVPPVAVSINAPNITLLPQEPTYVNAATFDDGSWDNCTDITLEVRRLDSPECSGDDSTPFEKQVPFFCCDVGHSVQVELKVTDEAENESFSLTTASVFDNLNPGIICPADLTIDCGEDFLDLTLTGEPQVTDNCPNIIVSSFDSTSFNTCGIGLVLRFWQVEDAVGRMAECTQEINVDNLAPFYINDQDPFDPNDDIIWPQNYSSNTCGAGLEPEFLPQEFGFPQIFSDSTCSLIGLSYTDTWLVVTPNACVEVLRNWKVIDWCQFNQTTFEGSWDYGQVLQISTSDLPLILSDCQPLNFCSYDPNCQTGEAKLTLLAEDDCTPPDLLEYTYQIDLFDNGSFDIQGMGSEVEGDYPLGTHRIVYSVEDGCNNKSSCGFNFTISDCKNPSAYCKNLIVEIMDLPIPMIDISALDFDDGSFDNCTHSSDLNFSFSSNSADITKVFECDDIGINQLQIWITDEVGNQDYCNVTVDVQDNMDACLANANISGNLYSIEGAPIAEVQVSVNSNLDSMTTDDDGSFIFFDLPVGGDYTIAPLKDTNHINGVTTFDLVLITKHILGTEKLDSPYKIIAADVNQSGTVTTFDLVAIRKLILAIDDQFQNNTSWRFVDMEFEFIDDANPYLDDFPEIISINNLSGDEIVNFIGIKIGDVNGTADPAEFLLTDDN